MTTPNPAPKPTPHRKSTKSYESGQIIHLVKYIWICREIALEN